MIVDYNKDFCDLITDLITDLINIQPDMEVIGVAFDGNMASKMILHRLPDFVLLDIIMPLSDGLNVLKHINSISLENHRD